MQQQQYHIKSDSEETGQMDDQNNINTAENKKVQKLGDHITNRKSAEAARIEIHKE